MANDENNEPPEKPLLTRLTEVSDAPLTGKERTLFIVFGIVVAAGLLITMAIIGILSHSSAVAR